MCIFVHGRVWAQVHLCHSACVEVIEQHWESVLSFLLADLKSIAIFGWVLYSRPIEMEASSNLICFPSCCKSAGIKMHVTTSWSFLCCLQGCHSSHEACEGTSVHWLIMFLLLWWDAMTVAPLIREAGAGLQFRVYYIIITAGIVAHRQTWAGEENAKLSLWICRQQECWCLELLKPQSPPIVTHFLFQGHSLWVYGSHFHPDHHTSWVTFCLLT